MKRKEIGSDTGAQYELIYFEDSVLVYELKMYGKRRLVQLKYCVMERCHIKAKLFGRKLVVDVTNFEKHFSSKMFHVF